MEIREAQIFSFGKLKNKNIRFAPGINVICGSNEAGKTTLHDFLTAMLFGLEKGRGRAGAVSGYLRYEPWHAPAYYSGALRFAVDGRPFYLERNFYHKERREILRNEADGEELSVAYGDLSVLLGGIHKETFGNTYDIPQSGAATGKELADALAEYLTDAAESGDAGFHVTQAVSRLRERRRKLAPELKRLQEERERRAQTLAVECELLQRDCLKLRENLREAERGQTEADRAMTDAQNSMEEQSAVQPCVAAETCVTAETCDTERQVKEPPRVRRRWIVAAALFAGMALVLFAGWRISSGRELLFGIRVAREAYRSLFLFAGALGLAGIGILVYGSVGAGRQTGGMLEQKSDQKEQPGQAAGEDHSGQDRVEEMLVLLKDSLDEKETRLYNVQEQLALLAAPELGERELQRDIEAAQMAADELERLAREFCEEVGDTLNSEVSRCVSAVTEGRYDSVRVDGNGKLWAMAEGKEVPPEALSRGTLEQFYLALRLAAGKLVTREEVMPVFLDEAFAMYDDRRLAQALTVLAGLESQVLLFTCQRREEQMLAELGIPFHRICMDEVS